MHRTVRTLTLALGLVALLVPTAALADEHGDQLQLSPDPVTQGGTLSVSGACPGHAAGQELVVRIAVPGGPELGTVSADDDGAFAGEVSVPRQAPPGGQTITVDCGDDTFVEGTVTIAEADDEAAPTPRDGVETGVGGGGSELPGLIAFASGLLLLAAGGLLLRRRSA